MFDRRLIKFFDWYLLGITFLIGILGLVILYSAVMAGDAGPHRTLCIKQLIWYSAGIIAMVLCFLFNYRLLEKWAYAIYGICVILLIAVLLFGTYAGGAKRWLILGPFSVQPSEIVKIAVIIILARYYSRRTHIGGLRLRELIKPLVLISVPFMLIVKQPDLGTAILIVLIAASMTVFVKIEKRSFIYITAFCSVLIPAIWFLLKEYQKQRILTFLNPDRDPLGAGYHIIQSKIAVGSGMISGKGFLKGTQNILAFLPEQHTDFIFSVLAEEWGFAGSLFILLILLVFIIRALSIAYGCRDVFGTMLAVGITSLISWQIFINIGMVMGLMPVVGVPLPFVSYGGSSIITLMLCVGILLNISMRRFLIE